MPKRAAPPEAACQGKRRFGSFAEARKQALRNHRENNASMMPYHCPHCGGYHSGRNSNHASRAIAKAARKPPEIRVKDFEVEIEWWGERT